MQGHFQPGRAADASCLASARTWRKEAEHLRDNADAATLTGRQRATLLREAEAAERQADWWLDAIEGHRHGPRGRTQPLGGDDRTRDMQGRH